jgi:hypothetical protein
METEDGHEQEYEADAESANPPVGCGGSGGFGCRRVVVNWRGISVPPSRPYEKEDE